MRRWIATEWVKLRTTRLWLALGFAALILVGFTAVYQLGAAESRPSAVAIDALLAPALGSGRIFILLLGVVSLTGEFRHATVAWAFVLSPRRWPVVAAKLATHALVGVLLGLLAAALVVVMAATSADSLSSPTPAVAARTLAGGIGAWGLAAMFGVAIGTIVSNQTASVVVVLVGALIVEPLLGARLPEIAPHLPMHALASVGGDQMIAGDALDPAIAAGLFIAYLLSVAAIGTVLTVRRDIA